METTIERPTCGEPIPHGIPEITMNPGDTLTFPSGSLVLDCPSCGTRASLPSTFTITNVDPAGGWIRQLSRALVSASATREDVQRLAALLKEARRTDATAESVAEQIQREVPVFEQLGAVLTSPGSAAIGTWIGALLMLIAYLFPPGSSDQVPAKEPTNITVNVCDLPPTGSHPTERPIVVLNIEP